MSALRDGLAASLAGRYEIERELGIGGMATVYLARDVKHERPVAIKVLRPELAANLGADRFLREIRTAARLQHPHILALHDSGDADGLLYYVMPYVNGESLRARLDRERRLGVEDAVRITRQIAGALAHAHAHDVVHRDIKPENILFAKVGDTATFDEIALVADFGIARAISGSSGDTLTREGLAVGTPSYMSPEQAAGQREIDGRADTYALACVLYEMLAGHPPFLGASAHEILARHSLDPVPPLRAARPELPEAIERAVTKALSKSPTDRYATVTAFGAALDDLRPTVTRRRAWPRLAWAGVGTAACAAILVGYLRFFADSNVPIAVMAFNNVGGDSTNEPFSDGIAEELTTALGTIEGLTVTARTSAFSFKGKGLDPREIGRRLGVRYIVDGAVKRSAERSRVGAQLVDVATGKEVWSDNFEYDARNRDVFTVQDSITRSIVHQLLPHLSRSAIASSMKRTTENPAAHDEYVLGRYWFEKRGEVDLQNAKKHFEKAIELDPSYAVAWAGLSDVYSHASVFGYAWPATNFPTAKAYVDTALMLDSTLADAHASRAFIALFYDWDYAAAGREFEIALRRSPRSPTAHLWHAWYFMALGKTEEGINEARAAVAYDRLSLLNNTRLVSMYFYGNKLDSALAQALRTVDMDSTFIGVRSELARVYVFMDRCPKALAELASAHDPPAAQLLGVPGYTFAVCDKRDRALDELHRLEAREERGLYVSAYGKAVIQAGLGNTEQAMKELERAYKERAWSMFLLGLEPAFVGLRSDPRFKALLQTMRAGSTFDSTAGPPRRRG